MKARLMARKDLRIYFRDRAAVLLGFGLPLVLCTVFAGAMGAIGGGDTLGRIELVIEDRDGGAAASALLAELGRAKGLRLDVLTAEERDEGASARGRVAEGDAPAGLEIGAGFTSALEGGAELPLVLYRDPGKVIEQQILAGNLLPAFFGALGERLGQRMGARILATLDFPAAGRAQAEAILDASWADMDRLVESLRTPEQGASGADGAGAAVPPVEGSEPAPLGAGEGGGEGAEGGDDFEFARAVAEVLGLRVEDVVGGADAAAAQKTAQQANAVAGMALMMLLFGLIACGGTLLEEEASGTLDRLRLTPGATGAILGGKFLSTWLIGMTQLVVLFLYGSLVFDVPILRAPLALLVLTATVAAAVTGFGLLFAVLCRTQKQLEGLATIVVLTMSALGGTWWPLAITPEWYQTLGHFTLNAWAMDAYQGLFWYQKDLAGILPEIGVLAAIALGCALLARQLWRRRIRV